jgi:hypothetical protein
MDPGLSGRVLGSCKEVNVADLALQWKRNTLVNGRQRLGNDTKNRGGVCGGHAPQELVAEEPPF